MTGLPRQGMDAPEVSEAQALLLRFDAATSVGLRLPMVFDPGKAEPLMHAYYSDRAKKDPERGRCLAANFMTCGDSRVLSLNFESDSRPGTGLCVWFYCIGDGKLLLDWESYVAWCDQDWAGFKLQHPQTEVTMRVVASESRDYGHEFSDDRRWLALHLSSADGMHSVTGYAERNSPLGSSLAGLIGAPLVDQGSVNQPPPSSRESGARVPVTVSLCYPVNARSDGCVFITRLLSDRWLVMPVEMDSGK